jgi:hypothetical protein
MNIQIKQTEIVLSTIELKGKYYQLYNKYFRIKEDKLMYLDMDENKMLVLNNNQNMFSYFIKSLSEDGMVISEETFHNQLVDFLEQVNQII